MNVTVTKETLVGLLGDVIVLLEEISIEPYSTVATLSGSIEMATESLRREVETAENEVPFSTDDTETFSRRLALHSDVDEAIRGETCRICRLPAKTPMILDFGREYAHQECYEKYRKTGSISL